MITLINHPFRDPNLKDTSSLPIGTWRIEDNMVVYSDSSRSKLQNILFLDVICHFTRGSARPFTVTVAISRKVHKFIDIEGVLRDASCLPQNATGRSICGILGGLLYYRCTRTCALMVGFNFFLCTLLWGSLSLHWTSSDKSAILSTSRVSFRDTGCLPVDIHGSPVGQYIITKHKFVENPIIVP
ncbi:hypothetical protein F5050DRAFT_1370474 [Lentinula boryana]|uniref:Uncharacterized protein n=1 Tax=Lentinula boryana TaxID=40481 RepID=A0ABQ8QH68_9AGAR|nr:hypothetical protein F5050DRAFT_1370474 [Lentinula boryana]